MSIESDNPIDKRDEHTAEQLGLIRRGIMIDLADEGSPERLHVFIEQGVVGKDLWELIISNKHIQFAALYVNNKGLKLLANFFSEMARIGYKIESKGK